MHYMCLQCLCDVTSDLSLPLFFVMSWKQVPSTLFVHHWQGWASKVTESAPVCTCDVCAHSKVLFACAWRQSRPHKVGACDPTHLPAHLSVHGVRNGDKSFMPSVCEMWTGCTASCKAAGVWDCVFGWNRYRLMPKCLCIQKIAV